MSEVDKELCEALAREFQTCYIPCELVCVASQELEEEVDRELATADEKTEEEKKAIVEKYLRGAADNVS